MNSVWLGAISNARQNLSLLVLVSAGLLFVLIANDLGFGKGTGTWVSVMIWMYLAIPAHFTALTGQTGMQVLAKRQFNWSFLWRAGALSISGLFGLLFIIPVLSSADEGRGAAIIIVVYLITEVIILALLGTCLPAVVDGGDTSMAAAFRRGLKTFRYVFPRLVLCNGFVLLLAAILFGWFIQLSGYDNMYTSGTGFHALTVLAYAASVPIFSFHVVMLATILSRAYLIAEGKAPIEPVRPDRLGSIAARADSESKKPNILIEAPKVFWRVKFVALATLAMVIGILYLALVIGERDYLLLLLPLALLPLAFSAESIVLTGTTGLWPPQAKKNLPTWLAYIWRSVVFSLVGLAPATAIKFGLGERIETSTLLPLLLFAYAFSETLALAKFGTVLSASIVGGETTLKAGRARGKLTLFYVFARLWIYNGLAFAISLLAGFIVYVAVLLMIDTVAGAHDTKQIRLLLYVVMFFPLIPMSVMSAVISARAYLMAGSEFESRASA